VKKTSPQEPEIARLGRRADQSGKPWEWYHRVSADDRCPIVDTWWQTETGGILITPLPGAIKLKPGSATLRSSASAPEIVDADGNVLQGETPAICASRNRGRG